MNRKERRIAEAQNKSQRNGLRPVQTNPAASMLINKVIILRQAGQVGDAVTLCKTILASNPNDEIALGLLGAMELQLGHCAEAVLQLGKALAVNPRNAITYLHRGMAHHDSKAYDSALADYDKALSLVPNLADAFNNRGYTFYTLKRYAEAIASFDKAIAADPRHLNAHINRGETLDKTDRFEEAIASYATAMQIDPQSVAAYNNSAVTLKTMGRYAEALVNCDRALALNATIAEIHNTRVGILINLDRTAESIASAEQALALNPAYPEAYMNRGVSRKYIGDYEGALADFTKALALMPELAEAYWNKSLLHLLKGEYADGWQSYEWRWKTRLLARDQKTYGKPLWLGQEPLAGKTILLHSEQGLGDTLQFCRYAPMAQALGARVLLLVQEPAQALLATLDPAIHVVKEGEPLPECDLQSPLMSLPLAFRTTLETIPARVPYLSVDPVKHVEWQGRLGAKTKRRVGLVWSGATKHANDRNRSVTLAALAPLLGCDAEFHSLQKEVRAGDSELMAQHHIRSHASELHDFTDTAALAAEMDLVISVDTSVAHLAAALGRPTWILLTFVPDFRWLLARDDSPWYPTARLFRQERVGDWGSVIENMRSALQALA